MYQSEGEDGKYDHSPTPGAFNMFAEGVVSALKERIDLDLEAKNLWEET